MKTKDWNTRRPQHLLARAVCLFLAVITWLCVMRVADPVQDASFSGVPLAVKEVETLAYTGVPDSASLHVRIRATKAVLATVTAEDLHAYIDMADLPTDLTPAADVTCVMPVHFDLPEGVLIDGDYTVKIRLQSKEPA